MAYEHGVARAHTHTHTHAFAYFFFAACREHVASLIGVAMNMFITHQARPDSGRQIFATCSGLSALRVMWR